MGRPLRDRPKQTHGEAQKQGFKAKKPKHRPKTKKYSKISKNTWAEAKNTEAPPWAVPPMGRPPHWVCVLCFCSFIYLYYEYLWVLIICSLYISYIYIYVFPKYFPYVNQFGCREHEKDSPPPGPVWAHMNCPLASLVLLVVTSCLDGSSFCFAFAEAACLVWHVSVFVLSCSRWWNLAYLSLVCPWFWG